MLCFRVVLSKFLVVRLTDFMKTIPGANALQVIFIWLSALAWGGKSLDRMTAAPGRTEK